MDTPASRVVVIGSGLAGYGVLRELRRLGPDLSLSLVCADAGHYYSKPALSTALAKGKTAETLVTIPVEKMAATQRIDVRANTRVQSIDRAAKTLRTSGGDIAYDALVLALGADPVIPRLDGDAAALALPVNTLDDYARFRGALAEGASILVLGAGLVGSEFANDLAASGYRPIVVDMLDYPLAQLLPPDAGAGVAAALHEAGVEWHFGRRVTALDHHGAGVVATLDDGARLAADGVLSAVGLRPHVALARECGLVVDLGIMVDDHGRTNDPAIYAVGDCAEYPVGPVAYVAPIMGASRAIAATITGSPQPMKLPTMSVQVKTTAYPLILLPPPRGARGEWSLAEDRGDGQKYLYRSPAGVTLGYVLTRSCCAERMELDRSIAAEWAEAA